jgi:hypothetical protein
MKTPTARRDEKFPSQRKNLSLCDRGKRGMKNRATIYKIFYLKYIKYGGSSFAVKTAFSLCNIYKNRHSLLEADHTYFC